MSTVGVVLMAYGSPADASDILRYYTDIRCGRPPTDEQLADLTRRYDAIGGLSPLLERTEAQRRAVQAALEQLTPEQYTVVLGLKHSDPTIEAAVEELAGRGVARVVGAVLAPHYSGLSVGQYLSRLEDAAGQYGLGATGIQSWAVEPAIRSGEVTAIPITPSGIHRRWSAATLRAAAASPPMDAFIELLAARSLPARKRPLGGVRRRTRR